MYRIVSVSILLFFFCYKSHCQKFDNFQSVDSTTYKLYLAEDWRGLIAVSLQAYENGIDYYYLRMRTGIAFYELKRYRRACSEFEMALTFSKKDEVALEYLYFSYLFSGQNERAFFLSRQFTSTMKERLGFDKVKLIEQLHLEGGPSIGENVYHKNNNSGSDNTIFTEDELTGDVWYFALGLRHRLSKRIEVFHSASTLDIEKSQVLEFYDGFVTNDYRIYQRQYYINMGIYLGRGITVTPAFHIINVNYDKLGYGFDDSDKIYLESYNYSPTEKVYALSFKKNWGLMDVGLHGSYANLNNEELIQGGLSMTVYPFGNLNYYLTLPLVYQQNHDWQNFIIDPVIGFKLYNNIWVEGQYTFGKLNNYVENNGYTVYNINDKILSRKGVSLQLLANEHLRFNIMYRHLTKENKRTVIKSNLKPVDITTKDFINHSIIGGITWTL